MPKMLSKESWPVGTAAVSLNSPLRGLAPQYACKMIENCCTFTAHLVKKMVFQKLAENQSSTESESEHAQLNTFPPLSVSRSPLSVAFKQTFMVIAACMPLYVLCDITRLDLLIPIIAMFFSLAMIWMIPLFGWVVLAMEGYILFQAISALLLVRELKLTTTYQFRKYELLDAGDWIVIGLSLVGMIYLAWLSIAFLNAKKVPILIQDQQ
jgi:hypothetical protein